MNQQNKLKMFARFNKFLRSQHKQIYIQEETKWSIKINNRLVTYPKLSDLTERWLGEVIVREIFAARLVVEDQDKQALRDFWEQESRRTMYKSLV